MSLQDSILSAQDLELKPVMVPEWGHGASVPLELHIGTMTGEERDEYERWLEETDVAKRSTLEIITKILSLTLKDEKGQRVFSDEDRVKLGKRSIKVLNRLYDLAVEFNGLGRKGAEAAEGKSAPAPGSSS